MNIHNFLYIFLLFFVQQNGINSDLSRECIHDSTLVDSADENDIDILAASKLRPFLQEVITERRYECLHPGFGKPSKLAHYYDAQFRHTMNALSAYEKATKECQGFVRKTADIPNFREFITQTFDSRIDHCKATTALMESNDQLKMDSMIRTYRNILQQDLHALWNASDEKENQTTLRTFPIHLNFSSNLSSTLPTPINSSDRSVEMRIRTIDGWVEGPSGPFSLLLSNIEQCPGKEYDDQIDYSKNQISKELALKICVRNGSSCTQGLILCYQSQMSGTQNFSKLKLVKNRTTPFRLDHIEGDPIDQLCNQKDLWDDWGELKSHGLNLSSNGESVEIRTSYSNGMTLTQTFADVFQFDRNKTGANNSIWKMKEAMVNMTGEKYDAHFWSKLRSGVPLHRFEPLVALPYDMLAGVAPNQNLFTIWQNQNRTIAILPNSLQELQPTNYNEFRPSMYCNHNIADLDNVPAKWFCPAEYHSTDLDERIGALFGAFDPSSNLGPFKGPFYQLPGQNQRFLIADAPSAEDGGEGPEVQKQLEAEQAEYGDLVILQGFVDRYKHLHLKWYGGLLWQQEYCRHAEWLMKADDDTVVHLARLDYWIAHKFRRIAAKHGGLVYIGTIRKINCPFRDENSKWYVNESVYPGTVYPDFAQGAVYLTTTKTITATLLQADEIVGFHLDDVVFTGILAEKANVTRVHQLQHFFDHDCNKFNICENGMPTVISIWGFGGQMANEKYGQIKSANCSLELRNGVDRHAYCPTEPIDPPPHCQHKA